MPAFAKATAGDRSTGSKQTPNGLFICNISVSKIKGDYTDGIIAFIFMPSAPFCFVFRRSIER